MHTTVLSQLFATGCLLLLTQVAGLPFQESEYAIFEEIQAPRDWTQLPDAVDGNQVLRMQIFLAQQNVATFEQRVLDISTPGHALYGEHMNQHELRSLLDPAQETVDKVLSWLDDHDLVRKGRASVEGDRIMVHMTVEDAETLLQTKYHHFQSVGGRVLTRTLSVRLPKDLVGLVDMIQPTTAMLGGGTTQNTLFTKVTPLTPLELKRLETSPAVCNASAVTPDCIKQLYGIDDYKPKGLGHVGVSGYLDQFAQVEDLNIFTETWTPKFNGTTFDVVSINGGLNTQLNASGEINSVSEANLDIQWTVGLTSPIPNTYFTTGGLGPFIPDAELDTDQNEPYLEQLEFLLKQKTLPGVLTTSYGEPEQTVPLRYRLRVCNMFAQLGARGVSVTFSSGDYGPGAGCATNDGKNQSTFEPIFPGACPWVTSVGGTQGIPESAVAFSSGGFSTTWPMPSYQKKAVESYLKNNKALYGPFTPFFNAKNRGFPDVAAVGLDLVTVDLGVKHRIGGTSASNPIFASVIALVNDNRLSKGKKTLGFLNPLLYANPDMFTDITEGRSAGCNGINPQNGEIIPDGKVIPNAGWDAVKGWDPVTGLGTPRFKKLLDL